MISHLNHYITDALAWSYKIGYIFIMPGEVCIIGIKMIGTLSSLTYKNLGKMANKIFNISNHLL